MDVEIKVRSIIDLLFLTFGLFIAPGSLFRIKSKFLIIYSNGPASILMAIRGFQVGLCALKSPNKIV